MNIPGCAAYVDDIIVFAETIDEHDRILDQVLHRLTKANLRLNTKKCKFRQTEINFLGHVISQGTIRPSRKNIEPIRNYPKPRNCKEVQRFLGVMNYHASFIPKFAVIAEPLRALTRKNVNFNWSEECDQAFEKLKQIICCDLKLSPFDPTAQTYVTTDASNVGIGGVLSQLQNGKEVPIAYGHKTLDQRQRNYSAGEKEALAAMYFVEHWEKYLIGRRFTLRSDHQTLRTLMTQFGNGRKSGKFQRWFERLQAFSYTL